MRDHARGAFPTTLGKTAVAQARLILEQMEDADRTFAQARRIGVVLHRMWRDGTEFRFTRKEAMALRMA